jgi:hypothetical protein
MFKLDTSVAILGTRRTTAFLYTTGPLNFALLADLSVCVYVNVVAVTKLLKLLQLDTFQNLCLYRRYIIHKHSVFFKCVISSNSY